MPRRRKRAGWIRKNHSVKGSRAAWRETISRELEKAGRLFVLGIGNRGKGDDAAGSLCVRLLKREIARRKPRADAGKAAIGRPRGARSKAPPLEVQVLDAGEAPESVTGLIRNFRPTHVLIVDAAVGGRRPGAIFIIDRKKISQEEVSTHRLPLSLLVRYLEESIGCPALVVGIEPKAIAWGKPVSNPVKASAARLSAWLAGALQVRRI